MRGFRAARGHASLALLLSLAPVLVCPGAARASDAGACGPLSHPSCPVPLDASLPPAHDMLTWDMATRVVGFRNTYRLYPGDVFHAGSRPAAPLARMDAALPAIHYRLGGHDLGVEEYLAHQHVTGLLLLKRGRIAYEYYGQGNTDKTLWTSRSVAKSVVSILVGIAIREGHIHSVDDPITRYLPELHRTAWEGVTLHQLMTHTSGVAWNEHYDDPKSDFATLTHCEALPAPEACVMRLVSHVKRREATRPGERWSYNTGGAWLVGRVLERATGMTIARYLETRLWSREPMEHDGVWQALAPGRTDMGGHGFNATLRDWGRFGLFVSRGGRLADGTPMLPEDWLRRSTTWTRASGSVTPSTPDGQYGYQWWYAGLPTELGDADGALAVARASFWAIGIYGQAIAIDPAEELVMVQWSTYPEADPPDDTYTEQVLFFGAVARALSGG
jgi:CubicO group peptidase (beta-lactamase class C family)